MFDILEFMRDEGQQEGINLLEQWRDVLEDMAEARLPKQHILPLFSIVVDMLNIALAYKE